MKSNGFYLQNVVRMLFGRSNKQVMSTDNSLCEEVLEQQIGVKAVFILLCENKNGWGFFSFFLVR